MKKDLILDVLNAQRVSDGKYVSSWVDLKNKERFSVDKIIYIEIIDSKNNTITDEGDMIVFSYTDCSDFDFNDNTKLVHLKSVSEVNKFVSNEQEEREKIFSYIPCYYEHIDDIGELHILKAMIEECTEFESRI